MTTMGMPVMRHPRFASGTFEPVSVFFGIYSGQPEALAAEGV